MKGLSAADKANGGHAVTPAVDGILRGLHELWVVSQAQVVIGAHVDNFAAILQTNKGVLRCSDVAFLLIKTWSLKGFKVIDDAVFKFWVIHGVRLSFCLLLRHTNAQPLTCQVLIHLGILELVR